MNVGSSRSNKLRIKLDYSNKTKTKKTAEAYGAEIYAGLQRNQMSMSRLAADAGVSVSTVRNHFWGYTKTPSLRTMSAILFELGFDELVFTDGRIKHELKKVG